MNTAEYSADIPQAAGFPAADESAGSPGAAVESAGSDAVGGEPEVRYGFHIGHLSLLVPTGIATEVLDQPVVFPLPRGPRWLAGMINQRGNVIPLFDLFELSGASGRPQPERRVLLIGDSADLAAIYIDELPQPLTATDQAAVAVSLPAIFQAFVKPAFFAHGAHWYEFEYIGFFRYLATEVQDESDARE